MTDTHDEKYFKAVEEAIKFGTHAVPEDKKAAFNNSIDHVLNLLRDASNAYFNSSFGTCAFLSIAALEETSKAELLIFRKTPKEKSKGRDPLVIHGQKQQIAVRPTTMMGRLPEILGEAVCNRLIDEVYNGKFVTLRESALYVEIECGGVKTPHTEISKGRAREVLLLALESADDILAGPTDHSLEVGNEIVHLMELVSMDVDITSLTKEQEIVILKKILVSSIDFTYREVNALPSKKGMEQAIVFRVALYMNELIKQTPFKNLDLDCEYNKNLDATKSTVHYEDGIRPDLLIHKRGEHANNKMVVEFKGWWQKDFERDIQKIKDLVNPEYDYQYLVGAFVLLGKTKATVEYYSQAECPAH